MNKQGLIITNAFSYRESAKYQCETLKKEFATLGVDLIHKTNNELLVFVNKDKVVGNNTLKDFDFVLYFDKDKYISLMLEKLNLKLFNSSQSIELCDDKMLTHIVLTNNGVSMPKTISYPLCYDFNGNLDYLTDVKKHLKYPFIVKENFGSLGQQVFMIENDNQLFKIEEKLRFSPHLFQEYVGNKGEDYRLFLIGNEVVTSMKRMNTNDFRANIFQGGKGSKFNPSEEMKNTAIAASKILGLDYCAVDFVVDAKNNPILIEVNSNAYFSEIEKITGVNIAKLYAKYVYNKVYKNTPKS